MRPPEARVDRFRHDHVAHETDRVKKRSEKDEIADEAVDGRDETHGAPLWLGSPGDPPSRRVSGIPTSRLSGTAMRSFWVRAHSRSGDGQGAFCAHGGAQASAG